MPPVFIPFDGWTPSVGYLGEGWSRTHNLMPFYGEWKPFRKFMPFATASVAFGPMNGGHAHLWTSGSGTASYVPDAATLYTGSKTRLFTVDPDSGAFTDVSRAANYGAGVGAEPAGWRFASVGNDIWATNWFDPLQRRTNNAGLFANGLTGAFLPQPRHLAVVREHLLGANLSNAGRFQDELVWSDADDATNFNPPTGNSTSIASSKRLISIPGQITGLLGGQYGLAFKRRGIFYLESTGTVQAFRPDVASPHIGTAYSSSIINSRYGVFFLGPDGFYRMLGLSEPTKISTPGIDQFLLDTNFSFQGNALTGSLEDTQAVGFQWPGLPLIGWIYRTDWSASGNNLCVLYNPVTDKWSSGDVGTALAPVSMMLMRPYANNLFVTTAALTWDGSVSRYAPFDETGLAAGMQAPAIALRFRPANWESARPEQQSLCKGILPMFSKTSVSGTALTPTVTVERMIDPFADVWETPEVIAAASRNPASGYYPFRSAARLFRITIQCAAEDFANFLGAYIDQDLIS